ncbi:hypothetical protein OO015_12925 [Thermomicrobium sp. 4228-Ro]|uniref:hypothetical protein n=1 Tax=Thermomicrobium sp. 4228-Ro TaxID=2993937 RepID=UPI0022493919|nr:hypothetical protein [Thermomicrobium sp. 4228-Ro]MCX2728394.1 hypothetical protein [Thermomicrobium sp. 4228-Ro]
METLTLLALALISAAILTALVALCLRWLGIPPARPEERTRGIELLIEQLRERFGRHPSR